ncbi:uncharacterized protein LOC144936325 [Lampetra fluviatilis]
MHAEEDQEEEEEERRLRNVLTTIYCLGRASESISGVPRLDEGVFTGVLTGALGEDPSVTRPSPGLHRDPESPGSPRPPAASHPRDRSYGCERSPSPAVPGHQASVSPAASARPDAARRGDDDDMSARRSSLGSEPRPALPFNQFLPGKQTQSQPAGQQQQQSAPPGQPTHIPAPLRRKRADVRPEEATRQPESGKEGAAEGDASHGGGSGPPGLSPEGEPAAAPAQAPAPAGGPRKVVVRPDPERDDLARRKAQVARGGPGPHGPPNACQAGATDADLHTWQRLQFSGEAARSAGAARVSHRGARVSHRGTCVTEGHVCPRGALMPRVPLGSQGDAASTAAAAVQVVDAEVATRDDLAKRRARAPSSGPQPQLLSSGPMSRKDLERWQKLQIAHEGDEGGRGGEEVEKEEEEAGGEKQAAHGKASGPHAHVSSVGAMSQKDLERWQKLRITSEKDEEEVEEAAKKLAGDEPVAATAPLVAHKQQPQQQQPQQQQPQQQQKAPGQHPKVPSGPMTEKDLIRWQRLQISRQEGEKGAPLADPGPEKAPHAAASPASGGTGAHHAQFVSAGAMTEKDLLKWQRLQISREEEEHEQEEGSGQRDEGRSVCSATVSDKPRAPASSSSTGKFVGTGGGMTEKDLLRWQKLQIGRGEEGDAEVEGRAAASPEPAQMTRPAHPQPHSVPSTTPQKPFVSAGPMSEKDLLRWQKLQIVKEETDEEEAAAVPVPRDTGTQAAAPAGVPAAAQQKKSLPYSQQQQQQHKGVALPRLEIPPGWEREMQAAMGGGSPDDWKFLLYEEMRMSEGDQAEGPEPHSRQHHEELQRVHAMLREDQERWQEDLARWKSRRRSLSQELIKRKEERDERERGGGDGESSSRLRSIKTYREMLQEKARRERELQDAYRHARSAEEAREILRHYQERFLQDFAGESYEAPAFLHPQQPQQPGAPPRGDAHPDAAPRPSVPFLRQRSEPCPPPGGGPPSRWPGGEARVGGATPAAESPSTTPGHAPTPPPRSSFAKGVPTPGDAAVAAAEAASEARGTRSAASPVPMGSPAGGPGSPGSAAARAAAAASSSAARLLPVFAPRPYRAQPVKLQAMLRYPKVQAAPTASNAAHRLTGEESSAPNGNEAKGQGAATHGARGAVIPPWEAPPATDAGGAGPRSPESRTPTTPAASAGMWMPLAGGVTASALGSLSPYREAGPANGLGTKGLRDGGAGVTGGGVDVGGADSHGVCPPLTPPRHPFHPLLLLVKSLLWAPVEGIQGPVARMGNWTWDLEAERSRQERWQQEQERHLQERYQQEQQKLRQAWERSQREVEEEERRYHEEEKRILAETIAPLTPHALLAAPPGATAKSTPTPQSRAQPPAFHIETRGKLSSLHGGAKVAGDPPHAGGGAHEAKEKTEKEEMECAEQHNRDELRRQFEEQKRSLEEQVMSFEEEEEERRRRKWQEETRTWKEAPGGAGQGAVGATEGGEDSQQSVRLKAMPGGVAGTTPTPPPERGSAPTSPSRSVSGRKLCTACGCPLGKGAAMIVESVGLYYHMECFKPGNPRPCDERGSHLNPALDPAPPDPAPADPAYPAPADPGLADPAPAEPDLPLPDPLLDLAPAPPHPALHSAPPGPSTPGSSPPGTSPPASISTSSAST